jgi:hypothetical protein
MAELVILNVTSDLSDRMHRLAAAGDAAAERWFQELWSDYAGPFECFLCGAEIEKKGRLATIAVPDRRVRKRDRQQMMISLICTACMALPPMIRWNRAIRLVKQMHGRQFNFKLAGRR